MRAEVEPFFRHKTVLVTGAGGYIAGNLLNRLAPTGCRLVRLSRRGDLAPLPDADVRDITADITSQDGWADWLQGVDVVYHLAGQTSAYAAEDDPQGDWRVNVLPLLNLCHACREADLSPFVVLASTATVIGLSQGLPVNESHPEAPVTVYDIHKLMAEKLLFRYALSGRPRGCALRLANVYGPGSASGSQDRGVVNKLLRFALAGKSLAVYGKGDNIRDYVYIADVVDAFLLAAVQQERTAGRAFFIGSGQGHSLDQAIRSVARAGAALTGKAVAVENVAVPDGLLEIEHRDFIADTSAFSALTGWAPSRDLAAGLAETAAFFSSNTENES